jgi:hypothetical protein
MNTPMLACIPTIGKKMTSIIPEPMVDQPDPYVLLKYVTIGKAMSAPPTAASRISPNSPLLIFCSSFTEGSNAAQLPNVAPVTKKNHDIANFALPVLVRDPDMFLCALRDSLMQDSNSFESANQKSVSSRPERKLVPSSR